jgi:hypothetical protein
MRRAPVEVTPTRSTFSRLSDVVILSEGIAIVA